MCNFQAAARKSCDIVPGKTRRHICRVLLMQCVCDIENVLSRHTGVVLPDIQVWCYLSVDVHGYF